MQRRVLGIPCCHRSCQGREQGHNGVPWCQLRFHSGNVKYIQGALWNTGCCEENWNNTEIKQWEVLLGIKVRIFPRAVKINTLWEHRLLVCCQGNVQGSLKWEEIILGGTRKDLSPRLQHQESHTCTQFLQPSLIKVKHVNYYKSPPNVPFVPFFPFIASRWFKPCFTCMRKLG